MPGRTPAEAVRAFLDPFRETLRILDGHAAMTASSHGGFRKGPMYSWSLNGDAGMDLGSIGTFYASMQFQVVDSNPAEHDEEHQGEFRCSSRAYNYKLSTRRNHDLWRIHWHPTGVSPAKEPHIHLPPDLDRHLPTGRITFEKTIMWLIEYDAPIRMDRDRALGVLTQTESAHLLHRTWTDTPPAQAATAR